MAPTPHTTEAADPSSTDTATLPEIKIRSYWADDHKQVLEVVTEGLMEYSKVEGQSLEFWNNYMDRSLRGDLADLEGIYFGSGGHFWVATTVEDGEEVVVGTIGLEAKADGEAKLRRMSVKEEYRRFGIGRQLVKVLEDWAVANKIRKVWLSSGFVMKNSHRFYRNLGYKQFKVEVYCEDPYFELFFFEKTLT
ncbi:hypothetical protein Poli38472_009968 [Pythium oligandrum]|uniref:N-acetyltransferase domain-containing protein n=1 Tax=Pythium oligandrum TaxID=41045 RepID=A0A8K1FEX4_PYTOL|nr:hypothetical protein Poli38472_009968 [Pythium oligandrum]|eukprot:TMW58409.1 hypothetical protein Poli38472_009968 [Pythium oligandrum]